MSHNIIHLLITRRFVPLFITQFLGAFNDNLFRTALVTFVTYKITSMAQSEKTFLVTMALGLFILPFFLFSATAGQIADKVNKARLIQIVKAAEVMIMVLAMVGFILHSPYFLMGVLFLMGIHSAFFGPVKYSILPDQLHEDELIGGNGLIEAGTFLAILLGTIFGGILMSGEHAGLTTLSPALLAIAGLGFFSSLFIRNTDPADISTPIKFNILGSTLETIRGARENKNVFLAILGISWFWLVGGVFLSQMPNFTKDVLHADERVFTLLLTMFSLGIGIGSILCNKFLHGEINTKFVPFSALLMSVFIWDVASVSASLPTPLILQSIGDFFSQPVAFRIAADLFIFSLLGGLFIVPLYAYIQARSESSSRSRIIAANNIMNALFMVTASVLTAVLLSLGTTIPGIMKLVAIANLGVGVYICKLLPDHVLRAFFKLIFKSCFRVEVKGMEHYHACSKRTVIIANHTSFLDAALLAVYLPEKLNFAVNTFIAKNPLFKPFLSLVNAIAIDPTNPMATKHLIDILKSDRKLVIFPEGRLTVTGSLMKIYDGPAMIADKTGADILPIRINGASLSTFSRLKNKYRLRLFPKITLTILPPRKLSIPAGSSSRHRRRTAGNHLYDIMSSMMFEGSTSRQTLFESMLEARNIHGSDHIIVNDVTRNALTYNQFITKSFVLGSAIAKHTARGEFVGVLLPNMISTAVTFFAMQAYGRVPAMINFSTGIKNVTSACEIAKLTHIMTSRQFIETAKLADMVAAIQALGITIHYLEDIGKAITKVQKLQGSMACFASRFYYGCKIDDRLPAVVLFTSGSEGTPKGVVLSHKNLQANRHQLASRIDFNPTDKIFNALPMFHSFGLTGGTLLPMLSGVCVFFYPSPLHYRIVPELIYDTNATIMFGTDTFLSGYAKYAHAYDFYSLRYVFAGAEKLKEETRRIWSNKFGVRIFEGYGATETSPILSTNTPMHNKPGSVGRLMPGVSFKLEPVPGIETGGKLVVTGPNIMLGYLLANNPGTIQYTQDQTYDTGDIVDIDDDGYITIKGRIKRFAKIGGEMVSLTAVETHLSDLWPSSLHAVVSIPDEKKGEQLILVTDFKLATREAIVAYFKNKGIAELSIPRQIKTVDKMPLLGTGKTDYVSIKELVS